MKKRRNSLIIIFIFLSMLYCNPAMGEPPGEVLNLDSATHETNITSQTSQIRMQWDPPEGAPDAAYYIRFDTNGDYTFNDLNTAGIVPVKIEEAVSQDYRASGAEDDITIYFHIAAIGLDDKDGDIGQTKTAGPFNLDIVPISNVNITSPEMTSSRVVTLTLQAEGATEMYISNVGYDEGGEWEPMADSKEWELTEGGEEKTVYVRFRDDDGNTVDTSFSLNYVEPGDIDGDRTLSLKDAIRIMQVLSGTDIGDTLLYLADSDGDGKIGAGELIYILRNLSG
ncbi:hypothetical protein QUF80_05880 [Desulfococcaceae bacterium HSG8]|nr:hypothetical protein [Desulfococcaceae bacterium HSG8]